MTEWDEFRNVNFSVLGQEMKERVIFDGRNIYEPELVKEDGIVLEIDPKLKYKRFKADKTESRNHKSDFTYESTSDESTSDTQDNVIHNQVFSNVANNDYNDEILEKIKNHHNELTLLIDALERQVLDNKKIISDQKFYISKMEKDVKETTIQDEELKKSLAVTINKLKKAEKKLEIVKRELLD